MSRAHHLGGNIGTGMGPATRNSLSLGFGMGPPEDFDGSVKRASVIASIIDTLDSRPDDKFAQLRRRPRKSRKIK